MTMRKLLTQGADFWLSPAGAHLVVFGWTLVAIETVANPIKAESWHSIAYWVLFMALTVFVAHWLLFRAFVIATERYVGLLERQIHVLDLEMFALRHELASTQDDLWSLQDEVWREEAEIG